VYARNVMTMLGQEEKSLRSGIFADVSTECFSLHQGKSEE